MKTIKTLRKDRNSVIIRYCDDWEEFQVKASWESGMYHTNDKQDALDTAEYMLRFASHY